VALILAQLSSCAINKDLRCAPKRGTKERTKENAAHDGEARLQNLDKDTHIHQSATMSTPPIPSIDTLLQILSSEHHLHSRPSVLHTLLSNLQSIPHPPTGKALIQTLKFRLLASDITLSLQPYGNLCLPPILPENAPVSLTLPDYGIVVQLLDIYDVTSSRIDALDRLEMAGRGESRRGREVIRIVPAEDNTINGTGSAEARVGTSAIHRLLLQDAAGRRVWGFELESVAGVKVGMNIGAKLLLRGCTVARGVVLLTAATATVLGGKLDVMQAAWVEGRKRALREALDEAARK